MKHDFMMMFNGDETVRLSTDGGNEVADGVIAAFYNEMQQSMQTESGQQHIVVVDDSQNIVASSFATFKEDTFKGVDSTALMTELPNSVDVSTNGINQDSLIMIDDGVAVSLADESFKNKGLDISDAWKIGLLESNGIVTHNTEPMVEPEKQTCQFWECPKCSALFHDKETCELHVVKSHDFTCGLCSEPFQEKEELENHIIRHISEIPGHAIQMIAQPPDKMSDTSVQQPTDFVDNINAADSTNIQISQPDNPAQQTEADAGEGQSSSEIFVCTTCGLSYSTRQNLAEHEKTHAEEDSPFQPLAAGTASLLSVTGPEESESSSKSHHQFSCEVCDKSFYTRNSLLLHMSKRHSSSDTTNNDDTTDPSLICNECGEKFPYKLSLDNHLIITHHIKQKSYTCSLCDEIFTTVEDLSTHYVTHEQDSNPFQCDTCGEKFKQSGSLLNHVKAFHPNSKRFTCGECGKSFKVKKFLEAHVSEVHRQKDTINKCRFCFKSFMSSDALSSHIHSHHTSKQNKCYSCEICHSSFQSPKDLYLHMSVHVDEAKHFECNICGKFFSREESLNMHKKTHTASSQYGKMDRT